MSVKAINPALNRVQYRNNSSAENNNYTNTRRQTGSQPSFQGGATAIVSLMDWIDAGGFITSFLIQDGLGMVLPRIGTGLMRGYGSEDPKTGEKRGLNWEFARREMLREVISGPIAYVLPLGMLQLIKKGGKANNVPVDLINLYSKEFATYAKDSIAQDATAPLNKKDFYTKVFNGLLNQSTDGSMQNIENKAAEYAQKLIEIEEAPSRKIRKTLTSQLLDDFIGVRREYNNVFVDNTAATLKSDDKTIQKGFKKVLSTLSDYSDDVFKYTKNNLKEYTADAIDNVINNFNLKRTGTRVISNLGMWAGVAAAYMVIPKIYNLGLKGDPGLVGTAAENQQNHQDTKSANKKLLAQKTDNNPQVSFQGNIGASLGKKVVNNEKLAKLLSNFEFDGAAMNANAMAALLFSFCLPPRYLNAKSNFERLEILVRDITSFMAILFGAKALSRAFSGMFTKTSGLALQTIDQGYQNRSPLGKVWQYFSANSDISNLSTTQLEAKYANIKSSKHGLMGLVDYIQGNGGNVKKAFALDERIVKNIENLLNGKTYKNASVDEIITALKNATGSVEVKNITDILNKVDGNKLLGRAKLLNSMFGFISTFLLVPTFMIWLSSFCKKLTAKRAETIANAEKQNQVQLTPLQTTLTNKPSMQGFLSNL